MQDIKSRELKEKDPNAYTMICFEVQATALRPRLHTKDFNYSLRIFDKGTSTEELQLTTKRHNSNSLAPLHKRVGTKPSTKQRKRITTW